MSDISFVDRYLYFRSLTSKDSRKNQTFFDLDFEELKSDFEIPSTIKSFLKIDDESGGNVFSSPFRISTEGLCLWSHYDVMDNFLFQIKGRKRVYIWDTATDFKKLYIQHNTSSSLLPALIDDNSAHIIEKFSNVLYTNPMVVDLSPGDILFIPSFFLHHVQNLTTEDKINIAINLFWKHPITQSSGFYPQNDLYGNKELLPYTNSKSSVFNWLNRLSSFERRFYTEKLKQDLENININ